MIGSRISAMWSVGGNLAGLSTDSVSPSVVATS
jgi:hypothetical protein